MMKQHTIELVDIVLVDFDHVSEAEQLVQGCEGCMPASPVPFDYLLDGLFAADPRLTEYLMFSPAQCPACHSILTEKTLVTVRCEPLRR